MVRIPALTGAQIRETVGGTVLTGDEAGVEASELAEPRDAGSAAVAFVIGETYVADVAGTRACVVVVQKALAEKVLPLLPSQVRLCLGCEDAYLGLARLSEAIARHDSLADWRLPHAGAVAANVHQTAKVDPTAKIGPGAVVCAGVTIGARTTLLPNVVIGPDVTVGEDCVIFPGAVLYPRTRVGNRVRLHANVTIGSDGFGYARGPAGASKIWHLGAVVIQDDVEIGPGTAVDRGTIKDTVIERGVKIDNLVQIGHNGYVKAHAIICAQAGLAGNVTVGRGAVLAGKVGVGDKIEIGDGATVGAMSGVSKDVAPGDIVMGSLLARPRREWWRFLATLERVGDLVERVKKLEGTRKKHELD